MLALAKTMFHAAWDGRSEQIKDAKASVKRQITEAEKQIDSLLSRIINATNDSVISAYEEKIARSGEVQGQIARFSDPSGSKTRETGRDARTLTSVPRKPLETLG